MFRTRLYSNKRGAGTNEAKKRKESSKSKKNEKISLRVAKQTVRLLEEPRLTSREDRKKEKRVECRFDAPSYTG